VAEADRVPIRLCVDCVSVSANGTDDLPDDHEWEGFLPSWDGWEFSADDPEGEPHFAPPGRPCGGCGSGLGGDRYDYFAFPIRVGDRHETPRSNA